MQSVTLDKRFNSRPMKPNTCRLIAIVSDHMPSETHANVVNPRANLILDIFRIKGPLAIRPARARLCVKAHLHFRTSTVARKPGVEHHKANAFVRRGVFPESRLCRTVARFVPQQTSHQRSAHTPLPLTIVSISTIHKPCTT